MKVSRTAWVALASLTAAVLVWRVSGGLATAAPAAPAPAAAPTSVAAVDVKELLENYQRAKDLKETLNKRQKQLQDEATKRKQAFESINDDLKGLKEGSPEFEKRVNEQRRMAIEADSWIKFESQLLEADSHRLFRALYEDIRKMTALVAQEQGYKIVLFAEHTMGRSNTTSDLAAMIENRKVLYADPSVDLTEVVLRKLNEANRAAPRP